MWRRVHDFIGDQQGHMALAVCIASVPLLLSVGLAIDIANSDRIRSHTQSALDVAAMEMALNVQSGMSDGELEALGSDLMFANLGLSAAETDTELLPMLRYLGMKYEEGGLTSMEVEAERSFDYIIPRSIADHDNAARGRVHVRSRISAREADAACVYALNPTAARALEAAGNTGVDMEGCIAASNSNAPDSIYLGGNASMIADCAQAVGGIAAGDGLVTSCPRNRERAWPMRDPFADLEEPIPPILKSKPPDSLETLEPGRYSSLSLNGTKALQSGLYYIDGDLDIKGNVSGSGVTFFLKNGDVTVNGNASLNLSAPTSGDHAGMLFWSAKGNPGTNRFNGNGATDLDGFLYFPDGFVDYSGNNSLDATCMRIVADRIRMTGNSQVRIDCSEELGGREARVTGPLYFSQ